MAVLLSIDQSTAATKAMLWGLDGELLARADVPHKQITNDRGWVGHDASEIYTNTLAAARLVMEKTTVPPKDVAAVGISNQRETAVCWDRHSGAPLHHAVVWQCARAADITQALAKAGLEEQVCAVTGLPLSPFFSAAKFGWMIRNVSAVAEALASGRLCCGTVDSWLVYKLTGEFKTDYSNASRTQLLNLDTLQWDSTLVKAFGLTTECLPEICHSDSLFGYTNFEGLLPRPVPVHGVMGDSHAALFGNICWVPGAAKATYGTGSSVMMNAGATRPKAGPGVAASLAWGIGGQVEYVLEGNINYTGAVTKWLVDDIGLLASPRQAGELAATVPDTGGVYLVPAFSGLGAPYFNNDARAAFLGMHRGTKKAHLARAAEECIAYQIRDVVEAINICCPQPMSALNVDGGPTRDTFLMQFQADMLDIPLCINETEEVSAKGVACCAALGAGLVAREAIAAQNRGRTVSPSMGRQQRHQFYQGWKDAIETINGRKK